MAIVKSVPKLYIKQKSEILDQMNKGVTAKSLSEKYKVNKSTIRRIKGRQGALTKFVVNSECGPGKRVTLRACEFPRMEQVLYKWFLENRHRNVPISIEVLKAQACKLHDRIKEKPGSFNASNGWFSNFKKRHGIRNLKICGEKLSNKPKLVEPFLVKFKNTIKELGLSPNQIHNADESGLFFKLMPNKTLVSFKEATAPGRKTSKERITFLACMNASGIHKIKLFVIGKALNPRAFKNFENKPVIYKSNKNAWMTFSLFEEWFHSTFVPEGHVPVEMAKISRRSVVSNSSPADSNANSIPSPTNDSNTISNKSNTKPKSSSTNSPSSSSNSSSNSISASPSSASPSKPATGFVEITSNDTAFPDPLRSNGTQFTTRTIPNNRHNNTRYGHLSTIHPVSPPHVSNRSADKINTNVRNSTTSTTTTPPPTHPPVIIPHSNIDGGSNITQAQILAAERERIRAEFFATYDVMTGVRIAATLGGFFGLMVFLIVWKSRSHSSETLRVLKDPKIAAVAAACMQEEEERKIQEAMEATGMSIYPDEYDAILYRRQRMLSLGNVSAPPVLHRGYRFSSVGGGGYSSLLEPPRRYSYSYGGGRRKSGSESSRILSNYPMGSSFGTDDYFIETDDEQESPEFEEHQRRTDSVKRHGFLEVPNAAPESRRSSAMTCCSTESSYLERRCSALTLGLGNLPPSLRRKLSAASRTSSTDMWDYYYPDIQVIQPTPSPSPFPSERNLYDQAISSKRPTTATNAVASIIKTAISSSTAANIQTPITTTPSPTTVNMPPPPLVRKHSIAYYDPESSQSGRQQHIHSISADTADFLPFLGAGKAVQLQEQYDDSSELKLIVKRKISAPEGTTNGRLVDNNNSYTYATEFVQPAGGGIAGGGTNSIGSVGSAADLSKNITTHAGPKRAPLASLSSFKISSLEYQDSEMRSLDEDSVFLDSIADTDEDMEQFSTDSDEISLEDEAIADRATKTPTLQTVVSPIQSNPTYNQDDLHSVKSAPPIPQLPVLDIKRLGHNVSSFKRSRRPMLERHRSISTATSTERISLIGHQMKDFSQQQSFESTDRGPPLETHFTILPRQDTTESTPSSQRRLQMKPLLQQQISAEQTTDEATTNTTTTTTAETCSTFNTEIPKGQQFFGGSDESTKTTAQHSHLPLISVPASLKNLIRQNSPPACSSVILELPLIKLPTTDEDGDNSVLDNNDDDDKSRSKSDDSRDPSLPGSSRKWSKETLF